MGRTTGVTLPDPDSGGPLVASTYNYVYNAASELTQFKGADPDGAGSLTQPVTTYAYNLLGHMTVVTESDPDAGRRHIPRECVEAFRANANGCGPAREGALNAANTRAR